MCVIFPLWFSKWNDYEIERNKNYFKLELVKVDLVKVVENLSKLLRYEISCDIDVWGQTKSF